MDSLHSDEPTPTFERAAVPGFAPGQLLIRAEALNRRIPGPADIDAFLSELEGAIDPSTAGRPVHLVHARLPGGDGTAYPQTDFGRLRLGGSGTSLVLGRTLLPGHPVEGERRFEVALLDYRKPRVPRWFADGGGLERVFLARARWASEGLGHPGVFGVFSELFDGKPAWSGDGGVAFLFASRVTRLFARTLASAVALGLSVDDVAGGDRATALLAHEWGHSVSGYGQVPGRRAARDVTWSAAIQHEWDADAAALEMLATAPGPAAQRAFRALVLDKLVRTAWYPQRKDRADAASSRRFVAWAIGHEVLRAQRRGGVVIRWPKLEGLIRKGSLREMAVDSAAGRTATLLRDAYGASVRWPAD